MSDKFRLKRKDEDGNVWYQTVDRSAIKSIYYYDGKLRVTYYGLPQARMDEKTITCNSIDDMV